MSALMGRTWGGTACVFQDKNGKESVVFFLYSVRNGETHVTTKPIKIGPFDTASMKEINSINALIEKCTYGAKEGGDGDK